jgi:hypothetical protein
MPTAEEAPADFDGSVKPAGTAGTRAVRTRADSEVAAVGFRVRATARPGARQAPLLEIDCWVDVDAGARRPQVIGNLPRQLTPL